MSSDPREPEPDDEDTGPLDIRRPAPPDAGSDEAFLPEGGLPGDYRLYTPTDSAWPRRFEPLTVTPRPVRRPRKPMILGAAAVLAVVVLAALAIWLFRLSSEPDSTASDAPTTAAEESPDPEAQDRLLRLLPAGYPSESCTPAAAGEGALAEVSCEKNSDPGGPLSSTYTLVNDEAALAAAFDASMRAATRVNCPGNIQSPGPWRRNATPQKTSGVLFCGIQDDRPTVIWTNVDDLLVSSVQSGPQGPTFDQLYAWWSSHS